MSTVSLQNLLEMIFMKVQRIFTIRSLTKRLIMEQRYIRMNYEDIDVAHMNILAHDKERINLRCQLIDLGVDPDVVAPDEEKDK